jgi:hypothetical protein
MRTFIDIPIPPRMTRLQRDGRGYPVPVIVMRDGDGRPIFAANDEGKRQQCFNEDRCHICGDRLDRGRWFVGGCLSAVAEHGQFMDGGLHAACCHYALQVCPYLAAPAYGRLVGRAQLARTDRRDVMVLPDATEQNSRPDFFVAVMAVAQEVSRASLLERVREAEFIRSVRPKIGAVRVVEVWRWGHRITDSGALATIWQHIAKDLAAIGEMARPDIVRRWPS